MPRKSTGQAPIAANPKRKRKGPRKPLPPDLSPKEAAFVDHYMTHFNASRAAREAGYSARSARNQGGRLMRNDAVLAEITARREDMAESLADLSEDRIREEMAKCAMVNMGDYMVPGEDGTPRLNFTGLPRDKTAAIQEITVEEFKDGRSDRRQVRRIKFKLVDKRGSLELLAKTKGMITDKVDHKHQHQGLIVHAMLEEINKRMEGQPIVPLSLDASKKGEAA